MKKNSIQIKIGVLMILAVVLLASTCYLSYRNLSSIVSSIRVDIKPDLRLISIREISMDLERAESSIRIYLITTDAADLKPYYSVINGINDKMNKLQQECDDDSVLYAQVDTISNLIEDNIAIWNKLLYLNKNSKVVESLKQLSERLDSISDNNKESRRGILKRVFNKKGSEVKLDEKEIISDINEIQQQDVINRREIIERESELANTSREIRSRFYEVIGKMEIQIMRLMEKKAFEANMLAGSTYNWLAMFSVSGILLALLVLFIIVRYSKETYSSQIAMERSKNEAENLAKTKELFIANMSHEIRTPLTSILGFTEQLLHEPYDAKTTDVLNIIRSSSEHLAKVIDNILDLSKLQNDKLILEKSYFRIRKILEDVYAMFEAQAKRNNTILSYSLSESIPEVLLGDPYRLKQIIINLISNAIKFTKNGTVEFLIRSEDKATDEIILIIEVSDTGIGIDQDKIELMFEDFTQEEMTTSREYGGTGLGLSIVKKLVELHNGSIECQSMKNRGTTIICNLPYVMGDEKYIENEFKSDHLDIPDKIGNMKILIVDDEKYNRLLFKMIFDRWNVKYDLAENGREALEILKDKHFDLVFMDTRMPEVDGLQATKSIRNDMNIGESDMPVICISAASENKDIEACMNAGMNAFLSKPFTEEMLLSTILSVIGDDSETGNHNNTYSMQSDKINLDNLYRIAEGDGHFVNEMLVSFVDSFNEGIKDIEEAVINNNWAIVADAAHKLIPPCRHISASNLCDLLSNIEESVKTLPDMDTIEIQVGNLKREFEFINRSINELINKNNINK